MKESVYDKKRVVTELIENLSFYVLSIFFDYFF